MAHSGYSINITYYYYSLPAPGRGSKAKPWDLPKVTELVSGTGGIHSQVFLTPKPMLFPLTPLSSCHEVKFGLMFDQTEHWQLLLPVSHPLPFSTYFYSLVVAEIWGYLSFLW